MTGLEPRTLGELLAGVRGARGDMLIRLAADIYPADLAAMRAVLGPLAVERAPARINALVVPPGTDPADVDAALAWLAGAASTTGQVLELSARA